MKWKKVLRSALAAVCSASLVLGLIGVIPETVSATDAAVLPAYVPEGFTLVTPESFGVEDYNNNTEAVYKQNTATTITTPNKVAFNGTLCMNYSNGFYYMSSSPDATDGIVMWVNNGSSGVRLYNRFTNEAFYLGDVFASATQTTYSYADLRPFAGTETLVAGTEILYTITTEVIDYDGDNGVDDIKLGVWFNHVLYNNAYFYIKDGLQSGFVNFKTNAFSCNSPEAPSTPAAPTAPEFDEVTFENFGINDGTYGYTPWIAPDGTAYRSPAAQGSNEGGIKNKTFVGQVNFTSQSRTCITFGGKNDGSTGFSLGTWLDGRLSYWDGEWKIGDPVLIAFDATQGVIGNTQQIKISFEVYDKDTDGADDIRVWLYFGDSLYGNGPLCELTDYAGELGNYVGIMTYGDTDSTVTVKSVKEQLPTPPTFTEVTFRDFDIENDTYGDVADLVVEESYSGGLANKTFVGKFNFSSASRLSINFGGSDSGWKGVALGTWTDGRLWFWEQEGRFDHMTLAADATAGVIGQSQTIKLSFEVVDLKNDGVEDVRFWLYFGDTLYGGGPLYVAEDYAQHLGNYLGIRAYNAGTTVAVESVGEGSGTVTPPGPTPDPDPTPDPTPTPVTPPTLEEITFSDLGVASGLYGGKSDLIVEKTYAGGFANKTFVGKVNFSNKSRLSLNFGGSDSGWKGFAIGTWLDGQLWYWWGDSDTIVPYTALTSEANALIGEGATLKISFEVTNLDDDGTDDDVRIWLYIGDTLYNNGPLIEKVDYAQYLGNYFGIRCYNADTSVIIASKGEDTGAGSTPTAPTIEEITFSDFKVDAGSYGYKGAGDELAVDKTYKESFLNKSFVGIATFPKAAVTRLNLGGKGSSWKGVQLTTLGNSIYFAEAEDHFAAVALDEMVVEGGLRGKDIQYKISFEVADTDNDGLKDDVRFWLYIGDQLYKNAPIVEAANYVHFVGNGLGIFSNNQEADVIIASADLGRPEIKEPKFPEITFSDFEIENGTYSKEENNGCAAVGSYREGFKNKTFVGTVNFNGTPLASIQFGGSDSEWKGVRLMVLSDGNLYFMESEGLFGNIKLSKAIAGCELIGVPLKIKLTVEVTDLDNDGEQDDVRYWLTLGDKLYNDEPIMEAIDYAHKVGNRMGIYASDEAATVTVTSAKLDRPAVVVDFGEMGFTNNWQKEISVTKRGGISFGQSSNTIYTGDISYIGFYMIICIAALSGICFVSYKKRH